MNVLEGMTGVQQVALDVLLGQLTEVGIEPTVETVPPGWHPGDERPQVLIRIEFDGGIQQSRFTWDIVTETWMSPSGHRGPW